jgi:hypothetical protein
MNYNSFENTLNESDLSDTCDFAKASSKCTGFVSLDNVENVFKSSLVKVLMIEALSPGLNFEYNNVALLIG